VVPIAAKYVRISSVGIVGFLSFVVLRQSLQAIGRVGPIVLTIVLANLVNAGLNWVLIYGHLGLPPLGPVGSAWATVASRLLMGLGLVLLAWRDLSPHLESLRPEVLQLVPLWRMLRLGAPIGVQYTLEYGVFGIVGILMGGMGTDVMGAHQVTINLASITFMVPLGLSAAAAVLVGHAVGKGDRHEARRAAGAALTAGIAFMSLSAAALIAVPGLFARVYTNVESVLEIAMVLIPIAGVFQVFDAMQVVSIGILRGLGDTRTPMIINVLGFWMLGLPVGLYLGFRTPLGPAGFWWGLCVGLSVVGTFLLVRTQRRLQAEVQRVLVDGPQPQGMA
jgi:MATE family multidrug resistance protein